MNTFRLVQEAAAAISEALGRNLLSGDVSAEGGKVTYTATAAPDGGWTIEITDLHPRGGRMLTKGMLAGIKAQIAKAATKQAGAIRPALPVTAMPDEQGAPVPPSAMTDTDEQSVAAQPSALPAVTQEEPATAQGALDAQEGTRGTITNLEAALDGKVEPAPPPAGYTCREITPPTKGGIAYYLRSTIDAGAWKTYRIGRNTIKYFVTGDPHLEVKETEAKGGIKRIRAHGTFRGREALFESCEMGRVPVGIAAYLDENEHRLDWYNDEGLLFLSQRWASGKRIHQTNKNHEV